jgi:hypothetical protein
MSLLTAITVLLIVGVVLWLIDKFAPMEGSTKQMLKVAVIVILCLWFLKALGAFDVLSRVRI